MTATRSAGDVDTVVISDVHLGADLVQHVRPWTRDVLRYPSPVDAPLVGMLRLLLQRRSADVPLRLVIAGDFLELVGMSILPAEGASRRSSSRWTRADRRWGLGRSETHTVLKIHAIAARHPEVMRALGKFALSGHSIIVLRGNHDEDLYWPAAQAAFIDELAHHQHTEAPPAFGRETSSVRDTIAAHVHFAPWFYWDRGLYIEHGHRFDAMSSRRWFCAPRSAVNSVEIADTLGDALIRRVINPTRDMRIHGHEGQTLGNWWSFVRSLGPRQSGQLFGRVVGCVLWWMRQRAAMGALVGDGRAVMREHEAACREQASTWGVSAEVVERLARLTAEPATRSRRALRCALSPHDGLSGVLARAAQQVAAAWQGEGGVLPWVVMGHTHQPAQQTLRGIRNPIDEQPVRYLNTGHWGPCESQHMLDPSESEPSQQDGPLQSSFTLGWFRHRGANKPRVDGALLRYDPRNETLLEWEDDRNERECNRHHH